MMHITCKIIACMMLVIAHRAHTDIVATSIIPRISQEQLQTIGKKIWHNECGGSYTTLLLWSKLEPFPSLGIGHFIWYPAGYDGPFTQDFPLFIAFAAAHGITIPAWMSGHCSWPTRDIFYQSSQSPRMQELRELLMTTIHLQAEYMIEKLRTTIPEIVATTDTMRHEVIRVITDLATSPQGLYALVDYLNFKGSGTNPRERYQDHGWGLAQVIEYMVTAKLPSTPQAFADAAEHILRQRVTNASAGSADAQRLAGWINRIKTYSTKDII